MNKKIQAETLKKFASTFEKLAQSAGMTMESTDEINDLISFSPGDGSYLDKSMFDVLQTAANSGIISQGDTFLVGIAVGQGNVVKFQLTPHNPGVQALLDKKVGPVITSMINKKNINGANYQKNGWLSGWGWV